MFTKTIVIPNISCNHCTHTVEMEVGDVEGVKRVSADVDSKRVEVAWEDPATWDEIEALLREINYPPADTVQIN